MSVTSDTKSNTSTTNGSGGPKKTKLFHGLGFQGDPNHALELVCLTLAKMDYEWYFARDKRLKCRTKLDSEPLQVDESFIKDFVMRKFLKFKISIQKEPNTAATQSQGPHNSSNGFSNNTNGNSGGTAGWNSRGGCTCYMISL